MQKITCKKCVLLLSAGIDSTTLLYELTSKGYEVHCLIFDYKQSLIKEVGIAQKNAEEMKQPYKVVSIDLGFAESKCSLISDTEIAKGKTFEQIDSQIPTSYVEFRNGILLAYATMYAETHDIHEIYGGFNGLNSGQYYDDTLAFAKAFEEAANKGTKPSFEVEINAPYSNLTKSEIVEKGRKLGLDYEKKTWSCYENGEEHCGECDSCKQRIRAFEPSKKYKINKIFFSIQGEGKRMGEPQVFLRFSGCNLKCPFCDTQHEDYVEMTAQEILEECIKVGGECRNISFCGGEPTLQLDDELIKKFEGWFKSIETNGLKKVPEGVDYIVCSPKTKIIEPDNIDELRYVIKADDRLPYPVKPAKTYILSPIFDGDNLVPENLEHCINLVRENPKWRLSVQVHKFLNIE